MSINNKTYDVMKWFVQYLLPAIATLYFALSGIWGLPFSQEIVGTIIATTLFLGTILGITSVQYQKNINTLSVGSPVVLSKSGAVDGVKNIFNVSTEKADSDKTNFPWYLSDRVHFVIKWLVLLFLPAIGTLYIALSGTWGLPYGEEIVGTLAAITTFLGFVLGLTVGAYNEQKA